MTNVGGVLIEEVQGPACDTRGPCSSLRARMADGMVLRDKQGHLRLQNGMWLQNCPWCRSHVPLGPATLAVWDWAALRFMR